MFSQQPDSSPDPIPLPPTGLGIDQSMATRLIRLGLSAQGRPIDDVIARLERADGEVWFEHSLTCEPLNAIRTAPTKPASLDALKLAKESAKRMLRSPSDADERLRGVLAYFVSVGVALAQHGQLICGRSNGEVQSVLADLATAVPQEWSAIMARASRAV